MNFKTLCWPAWALLAGCGPVQPLDSGHLHHQTQTTFECTTPEDLNAPADITFESRRAVVSPDGLLQVGALTFGGTVPGPVLDMEVGQTRRIKLINRGQEPIGLHFLGLSYAVKDDGTPLYPQSIVNPGCAHVYAVTAKAPGIFPFVDHLQPMRTLVAGQYGAVVVRTAAEAKADREYVFFLGELGVEGEGGHEEEEEHGAGQKFFMTINGRTDLLPLSIERTQTGFAQREGFPDSRVSNRVRFRLLNVSPNAYHSFGLHGYNFCDRGGVLDPQGGCPNQGRPFNIVSLSPLEGTTVEFMAENPGRWMYHCHVLDHLEEGMIGYFDVNP